MSEDQSATKEDLSFDEIIEQFKPDVDFSLVEENLKLTPEERILRLQAFLEFVEELHAAGRRMRGEA